MRYKIKLSGASPGTNQIVLPSELTSYLGEDIAVWHRGRKIRGYATNQFYDSFDRSIVGSDWDTTTLASASIVDGQLVTTANTYTFTTLSPEIIGALHSLSVPLAGDFEITGDFEWTGTSTDLGYITVDLISNDSIVLRAGMYDDHAGYSGRFRSVERI